MTHGFPDSHPLLRHFRSLTESTFEAELGIVDPQLADLLARFIAIRDAKSKRIAMVSSLIDEAESSGDPRRRCD